MMLARMSQIQARHLCLECLTVGGLLSKYISAGGQKKLPIACKFREKVVLVVTEPPAPEQIIWANLHVGMLQRFQDESFSVFVTAFLIFISYIFAVAVQSSSANQHASRLSS